MSRGGLSRLPRLHFYDKYFASIGILRPMPNAFGLTRNTGAACSLLNSLILTSRSTRATRS